MSKEKNAGGDALEQIRKSGWAGPLNLLSPKEVSFFSRYLRDIDRPGLNSPTSIPGWGKDLAVTDQLIFELARDDRILNYLIELLGSDVILWGASIVDRAPGIAHPWHTDIETATSSGNTISVWVALENASQESSLAFITSSHLFGKTIQEVAKEQGVARSARSADVALDLAKLCSVRATMDQPLVNDGQMLIFDGRVWHGSLNAREYGSRRSLILQYSSPDFSAKIPDWSQLEWPFSLKKSPRPPVLLVSGNHAGDNRLVKPPAGHNNRQFPLKNLTAPIPDPLPRNTERGWRPNPLYKGSTPVLSKLSCHASILEPGCSPHPPHTHNDEEILVILDGEAEIIIAESEDDDDPRVERMMAGDLVYYPSYQYHTIRCIGANPVSYFMYRWDAACHLDKDALKLTIVKGLKNIPLDQNQPFVTKVLFEGKTDLLDKLHIHISKAEYGGGYKEHCDEHDVAILLLEGSIKTMGRIVSAPAVVFHPAKELHGLRGAGNAIARYLVTEFHGPHSQQLSKYSVFRKQIWLFIVDLRLRFRWRFRALRTKLGC